jgi:hypothetical protein
MSRRRKPGLPCRVPKSVLVGAIGDERTARVGEAFEVRPLDESAWPVYADLVERKGGIWVGCRCIAFQMDPSLPY